MTLKYHCDRCNMEEGKGFKEEIKISLCVSCYKEFKNWLDQKTNTTFNVTLKCKDSKKPGHRLGFKNIEWATGKQIGKQRRLINACWHVHGYFFEALLKINPEERIKAGTLYINRDGGNWQDRNIGSVMYPLMYSEACECEEE